MNQRCPLLVVALALLAGCVTADVTVKADGSAEVTVSYPAAEKVTEEQVKPALTAPGVTIKSVTITSRKVEQDATDAQGAKKGKAPGGPKLVTATLTVNELEQLEAVPFMKLFHLDVVTTTGEDGRKTIKGVLNNPNPGKGPPSTSENVITIRVPGEIAETTATSESGAVVWKFSTPDYFSRPETTVSVTYEPAAKKAESAGAS